MTSDELHQTDKPHSKGQTSTKQDSSKAAVPEAQNNGSHALVSSPLPRSGGHKSRKSGSRKSKNRHKYPPYRVSLWSRLSTPILECRRCGERYRVSWTTNTRCPKCGRHPLKIQPWEKAFYTLIFPAALIGSLVHYGRSPHNAALIFGMGLAGLLAEIVFYFITR